MLYLMATFHPTLDLINLERHHVHSFFCIRCGHIHLFLYKYISKTNKACIIYIYLLYDKQQLCSATLIMEQTVKWPNVSLSCIYYIIYIYVHHSGYTMFNKYNMIIMILFVEHVGFCMALADVEIIISTASMILIGNVKSWKLRCDYWLISIILTYPLANQHRMISVNWSNEIQTELVI